MKKTINLLLFLCLLSVPVFADSQQDQILFKRNLKKNLLERYNKCLKENKSSSPECNCAAQYNSIAKQHLDPSDWMSIEDCEPPSAPWADKNTSVHPATKEPSSPPPGYYNPNGFPPWVKDR